MYRNSNKYKALIVLVFCINCLFSQDKKTDLFINAGFSLFKNQFYDLAYNKDQPIISKAVYLAIELQENKSLVKISFSKTYWLMMSPANLTHSLSGQSTYDNISIIKSIRLKNKKNISLGLGYSFISEQCFLLSPPSHQIKSRVSSKQNLIGGFPLITPYSSRAFSVALQYNFTKHLNVGVFANYNYIRSNNYIQLGLPLNNVQFQVFYRFGKK